MKMERLMESAAGEGQRRSVLTLHLCHVKTCLCRARPVADYLRRHHADKPLVLAVNKCESLHKGDVLAASFWELAVGEPFPVSAISGSGTGELLDALLDALPANELEHDVQAERRLLAREGAADAEVDALDLDESALAALATRAQENAHDAEEALDMCVKQRPCVELGSVRLSILGRPNVGKSSLVNALVGREARAVSDVGGTTMDTGDIDITTDGQHFTLVDTAGIRRRARVAKAKGDAALAGGGQGMDPKLEVKAIEAALRALRRCDCVMLVVDAMEGVTEQDRRLAELVSREGRACVLVVNKWDLVPLKDAGTMAQYEKNIKEIFLRQLSWATVVFTSAQSQRARHSRVSKVLAVAAEAVGEHRRRISTATLNMVVRDATAWKSPPAGKAGRKGRIYYATQAATRPPTFVFFVNDAELFPENYKRYMEKQLRQEIGFPGSPIRLLWRSKPKSTRQGQSAGMRE